MQSFFKPVIARAAALMLVSILAACTTNPATGERQFAALMPAAQEEAIGARENVNILRQFGGLVKDPALQAYVSKVGNTLAKDTERPDVRYQFFVLDSAIVNAFSLPGGYIYVTRGVLALANNEAQLAAVLAHEIGHITARHAAERYSRGVLSSLGAAAVGAAVASTAGGGAGAAQVANLGADLYVSAYSRQQENQADALGIRYLARAGYDPLAMAQFLNNLSRFAASAAKENGNAGSESYFSTHPQTAARAAQAQTLAAAATVKNPATGSGAYLQAIDGLRYGDNDTQGFVRDGSFWHPQMGFTFTAPPGYSIINNTDEIVIKNRSGSVTALFDSLSTKQATDPQTYLTQSWMKGEKLQDIATATIHGKPAATASFSGMINNRAVIVRLAAIQWSETLLFRFQAASPAPPEDGPAQAIQSLIASLRPITAAEKQTLRPWRLKIVTATAGDTVATLSKGQEERFRMLNGLDAKDEIIIAKSYKIVSE